MKQFVNLPFIVTKPVRSGGESIVQQVAWVCNQPSQVVTSEAKCLGREFFFLLDSEPLVMSQTPICICFSRFCLLAVESLNFAWTSRAKQEKSATTLFTVHLFYCNFFYIRKQHCFEINMGRMQEMEITLLKCRIMSREATSERPLLISVCRFDVCTWLFTTFVIVLWNSFSTTFKAVWRQNKLPKS